MNLKVYSDGGARGNPGVAGAGAVIVDEQGMILEQHSEPLGIATNNIAEYRGLLLGLKAALAHQPDHLDCYLDSELVVRQVTGVYKVKDPELKKLHAEVMAQIFFKSIDFHHIPRNKNRQADLLSNRAMDEGERQASK